MSECKEGFLPYPCKEIGRCGFVYIRRAKGDEVNTVGWYRQGGSPFLRDILRCWGCQRCSDWCLSQDCCNGCLRKVF